MNNLRLESICKIALKENRKPDPNQNEEVKGEIEEEKLEQNPFENEESEDTL